ncbi:MAG: aminotransferase class III-fold pyridoxal phosphate-dependent enzyme, partial [Pseudomonadota bacterium]
FNPLWKEMVYPIVVERSEGAYLWDIDGNRYVDLLNGFGPNFFGHKAPFVTEAIKKQLEQGFEVGPQSPIACEAAALFCELTGMERVSWVNTGSEAVQASMRIARTVTGRDKVVSFAGSYHGNFDEVLVGRRPTAPGKDTQPTAPGVPLASTSNMIVLEYGAEAALEEIRRRSDDIAMVMVEPIQSRRPEFRPVEFLKELRALTEEKGIVLLFDEVISGFRSRMGGAQEYFGVQADLATYGKVLAGGMPIGAVAGAKRFMDTFDGGAWQYDDDSIPEAGVTFFAGTFVRHPFAVAAAHACLSYMKAAGPALQQSVNRKAETLTSEMTALFSQYGAAFEMPHFASQMFLRTDGEGPMGDLFCYHLRERGVHLLEKYPTYMTAAHSEKDIDFVLEAAKSSLAELSADGFFSKSPSKQTEPAKRRFPLTEGQKEIFVASAFGPEESCAYNESITLEIEGEFDLQKFRVAFDEAVDHADAFRLRFDEFGDYQFYTDERAIELQLLDYTGKKEEPLGDPVASLCAEQAATPFDLQTGPLARAFILRVAEKKHVFVFYAHHIIFDGYSTDLLLRAIASRYNDAEIKELSSFTRFVNDVTRPAFVEKSRGEWAGAVAGLSNKSRRVLQLRGSSTSAPGAQSGQSGSTLLAEFDGEHDEAVMALAREAGVSPSAVYISIYGAMLSKAAEWEQVVVGIPSAGQALRGIETIGFCVSMWPIVIKVEERWTVHQLLKNVQAQLNAASERPVITMGELSRALGLGVDGNNRPIITAVLNISRYFNDLRFGDARAVPIENIRSSAHYDIFLGVRRGENTVDIDCDCRTDVLSKQDVERFIEAYFSMIKHFEASSQDKVIDVLKAYDVERLAGKGRPEEDNQIPTANVDESLGSRRQPGEQPLSGDLAEVRSATNGSAADPNEKTTWTETVVLEVAEQLLGSRPHLNENFFDIGGQSLMAVRFVVEIRGRLGKTIPLSMLFDCNDFRQFAHEVDTLTIDQHQSSTRYTKANEFEIVEL